MRVATVREQQVAPRITAVGTVQARNSSVVASGADGVIEEFAVEPGDYVTAGSLLSRLRMTSTDLELDQQRAVLAERQAEYDLVRSPRAEDVDEAEAKLRLAEAIVTNAQRQLDELKQLQKNNAVGDSAVRDGQDALIEALQNRDAARAAYERTAAGERDEEKAKAKARLTAQQHYVAFLEAEKEKRITRAPFDGFVAERHAWLGQWLSKGSPVITLLQLDEVDVEVQVDQEFIGQVVPGKDVRLRIPGARSSGDASHWWSGTVHSVVSRSNWEDGSRSFPVVIRIPNVFRGEDDNPQPVLREGMMAEAEFYGEREPAVMVPKDSIVRTSRGSFLFAVNPATADQERSVRQVFVEPGISEADWIQVLGTDLAAEMQVVTEGAERLRAFQSIQILSQDASSTAAAE